MTQPQFTDFYTILPFTILVVWACLLLLQTSSFKSRKGITAFCGVWFYGTMIYHHAGWPFEHWLQRHGHPDGFSTFANILLIISGLFGIAPAYGYTQRMGIERGEYYTLLLFSVSGMMLMARAADLIIVFLALELLSIPLYVLAAFNRKRNRKKRASNTFARRICHWI